MLDLRSLLVATGLALGLAYPALAADAYPVSVENCGATVTLKAAPKRIFMVNNDDVPLLAQLDALDLLVARTSAPVAGIYDAQTYAALEKVPLVATGNNATGGALISLETIIAAQPDLVLAPETAVDRQLLAAAGIALYSPPAYCKDTALIPGGTASFERVYDQVAKFGTMLERSELAASKIAELKQQVAALGSNAAPHHTGFALYVSAGGKTLYPYGARSMVTPVFVAAGLDNVYGSTDERVFEATTEELLGKNPDVIVLLYSDATPEAALAAFASVPGVESFAAVKHGRVIALPFAFTDPPTPLSVKGAGVLAEMLATKP